MDPLPNIPVLRGRRTRKKNALADELVKLKELDRITDGDRVELLSAKVRIDSHIADLRKIEDQLGSHPLLPTDETEREIEDAEDAMDVALSANALASALIASLPVSNSSMKPADSSLTPDAALRQSSSDSNGAALPDTVPDDQSSRTAHVNPPSPNGAAAVAPVEASAIVPPPAVSACNSSRLYLDTVPDPFDGTISRYRLWRSQFIDYVRRRTEATGCDKLVALCKLLKGPPGDLIRELPLTDENYDVALKLLDENYDVPDLRQRDVLASLAKVPRVRHANDTAALRELLNVSQRTILSLAAVDIPIKSIALPYERTIRRALPTSLLLTFEDRLQQEVTPESPSASLDQADAARVRLEALLAFLRRYVAIRERLSQDADSHPSEVAVDSGGGISPGHRRSGGQHGGRHPPRRSGFTTAAAATRDNQRAHSRNPCIFCQSLEHLPSECSADINLSKRKEILTQRRRCLQCFQFEHTPPRRCSGPKEPCRTCDSNLHYTAMHESPSRPPEQPPQQTSAGVIQTAAVATTNRSVVMTASAFVLHNSKKLRVRCFIDSGSMVSFAAPNLIEQLTGICPQARVELHLQGFASQHVITTNRYDLRLQGTHASSEQVLLRVHNYDFAVDPPANCTAEMLQLIRKFGENHPLADTSFVDESLSAAPALLIGVDQMYKILHLNQELDIGGGLIGKSSRFGWIVHGSFGSKKIRGDIVPVKSICCAAALLRANRVVETFLELDSVESGDPKSMERWNGPSWLAEADDRRPVRRLRSGSDVVSSDCQELRLVVTPAVVPPLAIDLERFSSFEKTVRVKSAALRFVHRCRRLSLSSEVDLRSRAEVIIIRSVRDEHSRNKIRATSCSVSRRGPFYTRASQKDNVFERMAGVAGVALSRTLGRSSISAEEWRTITRELFAIINSRPLSHVLQRSMSAHSNMTRNRVTRKISSKSAAKLVEQLSCLFR